MRPWRSGSWGTACPSRLWRPVALVLAPRGVECNRKTIRYGTIRLLPLPGVQLIFGRPANKASETSEWLTTAGIGVPARALPGINCRSADE
jgi:hypothetical protein